MHKDTVSVWKISLTSNNNPTTTKSETKWKCKVFANTDVSETWGIK